MFNSVEYVRSVCKERGIPISRLERDCGCGNGYLNPKKLKSIPYERALVIADYLSISLNYLLTGQEEAPIQANAAPEIGFDDFTYAMHNETKNLSQESKDRLLQMARFFAEEERKKGNN